MVQVRAGHVGVHQHGNDEAGKGRLRQGFGKHQVGHGIGTAAAQLGVVHQAEQTGITHFSEYFARYLAVLLPCLGKGLYFARNELGHLIAQQGVLGGGVDVVKGVGHALLSKCCAD